MLINSGMHGFWDNEVLLQAGGRGNAALIYYVYIFIYILFYGYMFM